MKKLILFVLPLLMVVGCSDKKEEQFREYAKVYYENHMKMVDNVDSVTITLEDLKSASNEDEFDLKRLEKCENSSSVTFFIEKSTKSIENEKISLKC